MWRFILVMMMASLSVFAADKTDDKEQDARPVPEISYMQKVDIVYTAKKDPRVLDVKIEQNKNIILVNMIVDKNQDREEAKELTKTMIMQIKTKSLDDPPKDRTKPGKGLYDYQINCARPDGIGLLTALKPAAKTKITFENPVPLLTPETPVDAIGQ